MEQHDDLDISAGTIRKDYLPLLAKDSLVSSYFSKITPKGGKKWCYHD